MATPPDRYACPRCGHTRVAGPTCAYCGVIFEKAHPRVLPAPVTPPRERTGGLALLVLAALVGLTVWAKWLKPPPPGSTAVEVAAAMAPSPLERAPRSDLSAHPDAAARALSLPTKEGQLSAILPPGYSLSPRSRKLKVSEAGAETVTLIEARSRGPEAEPRVLSLGYAESIDPADVNRAAYLEKHLAAAVADIDGAVMERSRARMGERFGITAKVKGNRPDGEAAYASVQVVPVGYGELAILVVSGGTEAAWEGQATRNFFQSLDHVVGEQVIALTPEKGAPADPIPAAAAEDADAALAADPAGPALPPPADAIATCPQPPLQAMAATRRIRELGRFVGATRGCVTLLEVWASWCPTCRAAGPEVDRLATRFAARGFSVLSVPSDDDRLALADYLRASPPQGHLLVFPPWSPGELGAGVASAGGTFPEAIPYFALYDREGRLVEQWSGNAGLTGLEQRLDEML